MTYRAITKRSAMEAMAVALAIAIPLSVHAGMLSSALDFIGTNVIAYDASENEPTPIETKLLSARTNPDPNAALGGGDIIVDGGAMRSGGAFGEDTFSDYTSGEISVHTIRPCTENGCETLSDIASMYDVSVKTIMWANDISDPDLIQPGDELVILPITGVRHVIKDGDSLSSIAKKYEADADEILSYNQLASASELTVGETVIIPGGNMHTAAPAQAPQSSAPVRSSGSATASSGGYFSHPLPGAVRTQGIHGYNGVDLAGVAAGSAVRAAAAGEVIVSRPSGWNGGYGSYVVIKHGNGTQTLYAHLNSVSVGAGEYVSAGQTVGGVGNSGRSTGVHLHFEVRGASNPF